ncbi:MAG TPA: helix-turn-helix transcriptional regulator [Bacteroidales bacterium]|nr:helix-turn-helix domain-containing protein [Bacteroidales bacterium]HNR43205.1 helix-turn-helix transcriptional regulator [Bacteroidales bacterium]HPM18442.1 helix-turn-helix transcriptional regulator [Bacteroidales bacterium]HQG77454.1 helix-turn-helix transcriptional regulator [Bacteroidales bacterium]
MLLRERIQDFLKKENKTSAQLAEEIGVQPSGISHILSGRNNPSLDFVIRMLEKYPFLSTEWLLFGRGSMYKGHFAGSLFDEPPGDDDKTGLAPAGAAKQAADDIRLYDEQDDKAESEGDRQKPPGKRLRRIVWFYGDNSFEEFFPGGD